MRRLGGRMKKFGSVMRGKGQLRKERTKLKTDGAQGGEPYFTSRSRTTERHVQQDWNECQEE